MISINHPAVQPTLTLGRPFDLVGRAGGFVRPAQRGGLVNSLEVYFTSEEEIRETGPQNNRLSLAIVQRLGVAWATR